MKQPHAGLFFYRKPCKYISMSKRIFIVFLAVLSVIVITLFVNVEKTHKNGEDMAISEDFPQNDIDENPSADNFEKIPVAPLDKPAERVAKKPFGIFITPQNSPVQPEKFQGYHTGADYEILPGEEDTDVPVRAVCNGKLREKKYVSGYGGVAVQDCRIENENVTVLYGHINLKSVLWEAGDEILETETIGNMGDPSKSETDGERKHLHLAIRKGVAINYRGYVSSQNELSGWVDPCLYFCKN